MGASPRGCGIGHDSSPADSPAACTSSRQPSSLPITPAIRDPSATVCAPVSVATSMIASGSSAPQRASASIITRRPSASVLSTSTVLPPYAVMTSPGRWAAPLGMFSAMAR